MNWFKELKLESENIRLLPIAQSYKEDLLLAESDGNLAALWFTSVPNHPNIESYIAKAIEDFRLDKGLCFLVIDKKTGKVIGTTRYTKATPEHRRLEIGYTWYVQSYHKTYFNSGCRLLLFTHAFEALNA